jgi:hypothetical protein
MLLDSFLDSITALSRSSDRFDYPLPKTASFVGSDTADMVVSTFPLAAKATQMFWVSLTPHQNGSDLSTLRANVFKQSANCATLGSGL